MIKLKKRRDIADIIGMSLAPILVLVPVIAMHPKDELIAGAMVVYIAFLYFALKNGTKPAAWIKDDILYIRSGMFAENKIKKSLVEQMYYEKGHTIERPRVGKLEAHILYIDMEGYQKWPLTISDQIEHLHDLRLYHFINDNFWPLGEIKHASA